MALGATQGWVCDHCRKAWYEPHPERVFEHQAVIIRWQVDIYRCRFCGAWWETTPLGRPQTVDPEVAHQKIEGTWVP